MWFGLGVREPQAPETSPRWSSGERGERGVGGASAGVWSLPWTPPPSASRPVPSPARASSAAWPSAPATAAAELAASSLTNFCIAAGVRGEESGHADAKLGARGARSTRRRSAPRAGTDGARRKSEGRAKATQSEEGGVTRPARRRSARRTPPTPSPGPSVCHLEQPQGTPPIPPVVQHRRRQRAC